MLARRLATVLVLVPWLATCGDPTLVREGQPGAAPPSSGATPPPSRPTFDPPPPPAVVDGGAAPGAGQTCAEEIQKAEQVPVDLLLTVDSSSSMGGTAMPGTPSKYDLVKQALLTFVRDPGSAGLGMGIQFFPQPGNGSSCQVSADCGFPVLAPTPAPCQPVRACDGPPGPSGFLRLCGSRGAGCPGGQTCVPLGRCSVTLLDCTGIGEACPGGVANNRCEGLGSACETTSGESDYCSPAVYEQLAVPIATLPTPGADIVARQLSMRGPGGTTPMRPAVEGALSHLRKHLQARMGRRGVFVLATDGVPSPNCAPGNTIAGVVEVVKAARASGAAIPTYVVGIATPNDANERMALQMIADAGGTTQPFIIGIDDLAQKFVETLNVIRGQSLPCEFTIPPPRAGGAIDFGKVNVQRKGGSGDEEILYAGSLARCDAMRGGWYYDIDPAMGRPTRIIACPATCDRFKADAKATVEIRFGCATRTIE
jgi:hypothetical protein